MESYKDLLRFILANGEDHEDRTGVGTKSVFAYQWRHDMRTGFPLLTTKRVAMRWVMEELRWFIAGKHHEQDLSDVGVDIWKEWATAEECAKYGRQAGDLGPIYGTLWRNYPVGLDPTHARAACPPMFTDQLSNLLHDMESSPGSRRLIVTAWHPYYQYRVTLPPCHTLWQVKCHGKDELSLHLYCRSIDAFLGFPFDVASYALLMHLIGHATNRKPRELVLTMTDLHIYNNHRLQVEELLTRTPFKLPTLSLDPVIANQGLWTLTNFEGKHMLLSGYEHHPSIKADVAI